MDKDVSIPPETFRKHVDASLTYINRALKQMSRLFLVEDLVDSLKVEQQGRLIGQSMSLVTLSPLSVCLTVNGQSQGTLLLLLLPPLLFSLLLEHGPDRPLFLVFSSADGSLRSARMWAELGEELMKCERDGNNQA